MTGEATDYFRSLSDRKAMAMLRRLRPEQYGDDLDRLDDDGLDGDDRDR